MYPRTRAPSKMSHMPSAALGAVVLLLAGRALGAEPEPEPKPDTEVKAEPKPEAEAKAAPPEKKEHGGDHHDQQGGKHPSAPYVVSGYVQGQFESHLDSEDQLRPGGAPVNQDKFVLRRARLKVEGDWHFTSYMFELDGNSGRGPSANVHHAEASLQYKAHVPPEGQQHAVPIAKLSFGLFDTPFGFELVESPKTRFFMERSLASRSFFPSEPDVGVRLAGGIDWFRYALAFVNGEPSGVKGGFALQDPSARKDFVIRVGGEVDPTERAKLAFGVSIYNGKGFHRGTDASKNTIVWKDSNENGIIDTGELQTVPGAAATPSVGFDRWLVGADLRLRVRTRIGFTHLFAELQAGNNMDRATFVADPVVTGIDSRELGWVAGIVQEIDPYFVVGFRTDYYDPNSDFLERQGGRVVPAKQTVRTFSPLLGLMLKDRARLLFQYDFVRDFLGRDERGTPIDLKNDAWTLRLQVML